MPTYNNWIKDVLDGYGVSLVGFADLGGLDENLCRGFKYGISFAEALKIIPSTVGKPSMDYYNGYKVITARLEEISYILVDRIRERGFEAYSLAYRRQNRDYNSVISYRSLAIRAGIGWIGKSATLVTKQFGNALRLNGVLTDMPLQTATPILTSQCEDCVECVKKCPAKAISGKLWEIGINRNTLLNSDKCQKTAFGRSEVFDVTEGNCGLCLAVCPWTKKYFKRQAENEKVVSSIL